MEPTILSCTRLRKKHMLISKTLVVFGNGHSSVATKDRHSVTRIADVKEVANKLNRHFKSQNEDAGYADISDAPVDVRHLKFAGFAVNTDLVVATFPNAFPGKINVGDYSYDLRVLRDSHNNEAFLRKQHGANDFVLHKAEKKTYADIQNPSGFRQWPFKRRY